MAAAVPDICGFSCCLVLLRSLRGNWKIHSQYGTPGPFLRWVINHATRSWITYTSMKYCSSCATEVARNIPKGDTRERWVCGNCGVVHYQNPKIVVGCIPERDGKILLCKRAIEPRRGFWTAPAGFMELGESIAEGAARETLEEACAKVEIGHLFASVDVVYAGQLHLFFKAKLLSDFAAGDESLDVKLFEVDDIPWNDLAFTSNRFALEKYIGDAGRDNGVHMCAIKKKRESDPI